MKRVQHLLIFPALLAATLFASAEAKPRLTLDEFFNSVSYTAVAISPDGASVVIGTERPDWNQEIFRRDLWLYRDDAKSGSLIQLTRSGHDSDPKWSPDGRWIAFLSERNPPSEKDSNSNGDKNKGKEETSQIYLISPSGGEATPLTAGEEEVHTFSWSADSHTIYFATRQPWTKTQEDSYKKQWKDVEEYRTAERGDTIFALDIPAAPAHRSVESAREDSDSENESGPTPAARAIATFSLRMDEIVTSPDGSKLALLTNAINQREEKYEDVEIYVLDLAIKASAAADSNPKPEKAPAQPRRLTHNQAVEIKLHWANDSRHIFFSLEEGDISAGPYHDVQPHLYWIDSESGTIEQWSKEFIGSIEHYTVASAAVLASARLGTEVAMYSVAQPSQPWHKLNGWEGTYEALSASAHSPRIAFIHSSLQKPAEVYLAESSDKLAQARPITSFNKLFTERDLPQGKPYRWNADDGTVIEGMLIYPPGKFEAKHLPLFTYIHGGPNDADGNHFEADWYVWGSLAATEGWLVFEPNYRGSTGYGDKFLSQIVPEIVSRPGKDILDGVDALVKEGIADPDHLTIGGYSYGGFLTNWLITQTTRFKAAVTGAGAVEYVSNWGNDDTAFDDAYFLGGRPWEAPQRYQSEAPIFQIDKVRTPTHIVSGADDIRVPPLENYLLEHALYSLGVPNKLLIFPSEGHSLAKNPWHGKIKVREELKWLQKYGGVPANDEPNPPVPTPK
jgi:dipeptidyl aminopeptidase/acylaminoacyl peptidase